MTHLSRSTAGSTSVSRTLRAVLLGVAASALVVTVGLPAHATGEVPTGPSPTGPPPTTGQGATGDSDSTAVGTRGTCGIVSTSSYLGVSCANGALGSPESIKQILGGEDLPTCWNDAMTDQEKASLHLQDVSPKHWYWVRCLTGIDPKTLKKTGEVKISVSWAAYGPDDKLVFLKGGQKALVDFFSQDDQIPYPVAGVSPLAHPRVGGWISFFDGYPDPDHQISVPEGAVTLTAKEVSIDVEPLGVGLQPKVSCAGTGYVAKPGETKADKPDACWYKYEKSSAAQDGNSYPVNMTSHWEVYVSVNGVTEVTPFNTFTKSQVTRFPVTEIEAIVVQ